jgi:hypothetical protein
LFTILNISSKVRCNQPGIYLVDGDTSPTQIVVSEELSEEDNLWLNSLRYDLEAARLVQIAGTKKSDLPMDAYIYVIGEANIKAMEELYMRRKKGVILSETLDAAFEEKFGATYRAIGERIGEAEGGRNATLAVLRARFKRVPREVEKGIRAISDPIALQSWAVQAATCQSLDEFAEAVK